jgi:hypothetical protein
MQSRSMLPTFIWHVRREEYGSAAQLVNNELADRRFENVRQIADVLDQWQAGSSLMSEHAFCVRSVYRSILFERALRLATILFLDRDPPPPRAVEMDIADQKRALALSLRLTGMGDAEFDAWMEQRWLLTCKLTTQWSAPKHGATARPLVGRN